MTPVRLSGPLSSIVIAHHNGPGLRAILWVQGCTLLCTRRCLNPHLLTSTGGHLVDGDAIAERIVDLARDYRELEGVTILGGEPFDQAPALMPVLDQVRRSGLSTMVYTGHVVEHLAANGDEGHHALLSVIDVLVDGPFIDSLYDPTLIWRGSTNQRLVSLTARYSKDDLERAAAAQGRAMYLSVTGTQVIVAGSQSRDSASQMRHAAARIGGRA